MTGVIEISSLNKDVYFILILHKGYNDQGCNAQCVEDVKVAHELGLAFNASASEMAY